jgi:hypothetical protein
MRTSPGRRVALIAAAAVVGVACIAAVVMFALRGGFDAQVSVQSGTRTVCTYGEVISDNVKVIKVPSSQVGKYTVQVKTITCDKHKMAERLYAEAQALIAQGDLKQAEVKLAEVIALDSGYKAASSQVADIKSGKKPTADTTGRGGSGGSGGGASGGGTGQNPVTPTDSLKRYVPDALAGYKAQPAVVDPLTLTRQYTPVSRPNVLSLVIVAQQFKNADGATNALKSDIKRSYPSDASSVPAGGKTAYFGTDGRRFAVVAVNFGGILVAIEGSVKSGDPASLKSELAAVAAAITK